MTPAKCTHKTDSESPSPSVADLPNLPTEQLALQPVRKTIGTSESVNDHSLATQARSQQKKDLSSLPKIAESATRMPKRKAGTPEESAEFCGFIAIG